MTVHIPAPDERGRVWSGRSLRYVAGSLAATMAITLLDGVSTAAVAAPAGAIAAEKKSHVTQAADIPSARVAARLSGKRVEALSERTETSTTWVNKDGSLTTELSAGPVRFHDEDSGDWRDVDVNLVAGADGAVEAKAHPNGLRLAGKTGTPAASLKAGQASKAVDLVTLGEGDEQITLQWRGGVSAPQLEGTRAGYVKAVPGAGGGGAGARTRVGQEIEIKKRPAPGGAHHNPPPETQGGEGTGGGGGGGGGRGRRERGAAGGRPARARRPAPAGTPTQGWPRR